MEYSLEFPLKDACWELKVVWRPDETTRSPGQCFFLRFCLTLHLPSLNVSRPQLVVDCVNARHVVHLGKVRSFSATHTLPPSPPLLVPLLDSRGWVALSVPIPIDRRTPKTCLLDRPHFCSPSRMWMSLRFHPTRSATAVCSLRRLRLEVPLGVPMLCLCDLAMSVRLRWHSPPRPVFSGRTGASRGGHRCPEPSPSPQHMRA